MGNILRGPLPRPLPDAGRGDIYCMNVSLIRSFKSPLPFQKAPLPASGRGRGLGPIERQSVLAVMEVER